MRDIIRALLFGACLSLFLQLCVLINQIILPLLQCFDNLWQLQEEDYISHCRRGRFRWHHQIYLATLDYPRMLLPHHTCAYPSLLLPSVTKHTRRMSHVACQCTMTLAHILAANHATASDEELRIASLPPPDSIAS